MNDRLFQKKKRQARKVRDLEIQQSLRSTGKKPPKKRRKQLLSQVIEKEAA